MKRAPSATSGDSPAKKRKTAAGTSANGHAALWPIARVRTGARAAAANGARTAMNVASEPGSGMGLLETARRNL